MFKQISTFITAQHRSNLTALRAVRSAHRAAMATRRHHAR